MDLNKLTQGEKIVLAAGLLLILDLLFLPWHRISGGVGAALEALGADTTRTAVQSPKGGYGILAFLITLVMVLQIALAKFTTTKLPDLPVPWSQVHFIAGLVVLGLLFLKLVTETDFLGFGAWLGLLLAGGLAFGGFTIKKETTGRTSLG
jgi:hypothetical protein